MRMAFRLSPIPFSAMLNTAQAAGAATPLKLSAMDVEKDTLPLRRYLAVQFDLDALRRKWPAEMPRSKDNR